MITMSLLMLSLAGPLSGGPLFAVPASTGTGCRFVSEARATERGLVLGSGQPPPVRMSLRCRRIRQLQLLLGARSDTR
jgi:hypothetical protein